MLAVCDGLGGHPAGDLASATAVESLRASARQGRRVGRATWSTALHAAHDAVLAAADEDPDRDRDGAPRPWSPRSVTASVRVAHVGDSRAYLLRPRRPARGR